jgi:NAD(P)-dependent dehydrogenase (short-subunit alcohol dehydrogenase family)
MAQSVLVSRIALHRTHVVTADTQHWTYVTGIRAYRSAAALARRLNVTDPEQPAAARAEVGDRPLAGLVNNAGILRGGPLEFVPIDTLSASRYARTPASFVHRMGASTHDFCSPGRDTR